MLIYGVIDIRSMKYTIQILGLYVMFALHCKLEIKFGFQRSIDNVNVNVKLRPP